MSNATPYPFSKLLYTSDNKYFYYNSGATSASSPTGQQNKFFSFTTGNFYSIGTLQFFNFDDGLFYVQIYNGPTNSGDTFLEQQYSLDDGQNPQPIPLILPPLTQLTGFATVDGNGRNVYCTFSGKTGGTIRQENQELITTNNNWAKQ